MHDHDDLRDAILITCLRAGTPSSEYLSDTVILLRLCPPLGSTDVHLALEVVKMRMSAHSREIKPYELMQDQVLVYSEPMCFKNSKKNTGGSRLKKCRHPFYMDVFKL